MCIHVNVSLYLQDQRGKNDAEGVCKQLGLSAKSTVIITDRTAAVMIVIVSMEAIKIKKHK